LAFRELFLSNLPFVRWSCFLAGVLFLLGPLVSERLRTFEVTDATLAVLARQHAPADLISGLSHLKGTEITGRKAFVISLLLLPGSARYLDSIVEASWQKTVDLEAAVGFFSLGLVIMVVEWRARRSRPAAGEEQSMDIGPSVDFERQRRQHELRKARLFDDNIGRRFLIKQVSMKNLDFYDDFSWDFQPGMNVLLGRNGYGKTHLLRGIVAAMQWDDQCVSDFSGPSPSASSTIRVTMTRDGEPLEIACRRGIVVNTKGKVPLLAIPDCRFVDRSRTSLTVISDKRGDLTSDGAYHFLYQEPYDAPLLSFLYDLCGEYMRKRRQFRPPVFQLVRSVVRELTDSGFDFAQVEDLEQGRYRLLVYSEGNEKRPLPIQVASQGTLSVIVIFGQIFAFLRSVFAPEVSETDLLKQPAIVLIDEVDAHLHPLWQQKILHLLRTTFPQVQFVVTAHSPLVVAGCRDGEVAVLRKTEDKFKVVSIPHDFIGREPQEIYREVFGIEEKDSTFDYYTSLDPRRPQLEQEYAQLKEKVAGTEKPSAADEERLRQLAEDLYYIDKAKVRRSEELGLEELKRENERLRFQLDKLQRKVDEDGQAAR
jgi:hypothetical protein